MGANEPKPELNPMLGWVLVDVEQLRFPCGPPPVLDRNSQLDKHS